MNNKNSKFSKAWSWIPSLYFAQGIPYVIVMTVAVIMYKRMGVSNTDIALYTSWLYLPWVIKPFWSPLVEMFKTKRFWIIVMQIIVGGGLAGVALTIPLPDFFQYTLAFLWLLAFSSATHDIAADGFYMLGLSKHDQAFFVGIRSTFYRMATLTGQGLIIILAGYFESTTGLPSVEATVYAQPDAKNIVIEDPSLFNSSNTNDIEIQISTSELKIETKNLAKDKSDSLIQFAKTSNAGNGFYQTEQIASSSVTAISNNEDNWLEKTIRKLFGKETTISSDKNYNGNVGIIGFRLSKIPEDDDEIVINFGHKSGDQSIALIEGTRFIFNKSNWNKPAYSVFQLDPKLKSFSSATFKATAGNIRLSWVIAFSVLAGLFVLFFIYHRFILPYPDSDKPVVNDGNTHIFKEFFNTFVLFFKKERIGLIIAFLLVYRLGESQLVKLASPFLLDSKEMGGLGLTTGEVGLVYGTIGILALTLGGILGGYLASKHGLKYWLWWMLIAINVPNTVYIYLSYAMPDSFFIINLCVAIEQFGYGFGFTAYLLYTIYISEGTHKTSHFAIATGFMALGMMIPGMVSGWLQEIIGYQNFFIWVVIATIPAFIITRFIPLDSEFGKK